MSFKVDLVVDFTESTSPILPMGPYTTLPGRALTVLVLVPEGFDLQPTEMTWTYPLQVIAHSRGLASREGTVPWSFVVYAPPNEAGAFPYRIPIMTSSTTTYTSRTANGTIDVSGTGNDGQPA